MSRFARAFHIPPGRRPYLACEAALVLYFVGLWCAALLSDRPVSHVWRQLGVYTFNRPFFDLTIVANAAAVAADGDSPYERTARNNGFPQYNYPRVWLGLNKLGLGYSTVPFWGLAIAVAFWAASLVLLRPRAMPHAATIVALWCSPAVMLGVERANIDLVVFVIVSGAVFAARHSTALAASGILLAGVGKLFPMAAALALLSNPSRRMWAYLLGIASAFAVYVSFSWSDIAAIAANTPRDTHLSYGCAIPLQLAAVPYAWAYAIGAGAAGAVALTWIRWLGVLPPLPSAARTALLAGAGTYCGTFLIGNNYEYRMVFLQLCLPALWFWCENPDQRVRRFAWAVISLMVLACWWSLVDRQAPALGAGRHVVSFALFGAIATAGYSALAPLFSKPVGIGLR